MPTLREKIVVQYHDIDNINFENEVEYFGGLPRIKFEDWPIKNKKPATHLLSIRLHEVINDTIGIAVFFHNTHTKERLNQDLYSLVKFSDQGFCEQPPGALLMPPGRIVREPLTDDTCLDSSFISKEPVMRYGNYEGEAFLAQLTNDTLPFPSESITLYIDVNHPPFWQI